MLVDSHCHLDLIAESGVAIADVVARAKAADVIHLLTVSTRLSTVPRLFEIARDYPDVSTSVGLHPNEQEEIEPTLETLIALADHKSVVAIGETGLDYYRSEGDLTWQRNRFRVHISAARFLKKPLIVHTRSAAEDTMMILQEMEAREVGGVMHCFSESWEIAEAALDLGFYISFSGIVTFKNAKALQAVAQRVPLNRILVETDSPYLAPEPHRGKPNEPAFVYHTAQYLAALKGVPFEKFCEQTTANFFALFHHATFREKNGIDLL